ncbi:MAG TPA: DUF998 domain-containing protein [Anaerolineae bacterium]|nr:DUF998 domain-containing protein [Anaerolineae bacterium]
MQPSAGLPELLHRTLLTCGILAALLYAGTDILAGLLTRGYNLAAQSASALSAVGAPARPLVLPLNVVAHALLIAFAVGVWSSADRNWALRAMACLLAGNALLALVATAFFPPHIAEAGNLVDNAPFVTLMATSVLCFVLAIAFGAAGNHNWLRYGSLGVLLLFVGGGILAALISRAAPGSRPEPLVGAQQRTMIYAEMLWLALQAVVLLRA